MKKYPFKFLDAYTKEDKDIFFGREEELEELYRLVFQTNLLLVYGASGTGKTSLIRCGLANRFKPSQWLDLYVRRGDNINQSLQDTVVKHTPQKAAAGPAQGDELDWFESMMEAEEAAGTPETGASDFETDNPIAKALQELYLASFTPIYLIFDQFEELYTLGNAREQRQLTKTIEELVQLPLPLKIIIVMREEYLANLYELERAVPQLRHKKLRIEPMDLPRAGQVILQATVDNPGSNVDLEKGREKAIVREIIEKIREGDVNIKLPYLQVFMDRLYEKATGEPVVRTKAAILTLDLVNSLGSIGDVLAEFIEQQSRLIHGRLSQKYGKLPEDIVWQILSPFATMNGTKVPIKQEDLAGLQPALDLPGALIREAVAELENSRILRYRREEDTYEVAHDTLAFQIAEKRSEEEKAYLKARRMVTEGYTTFQDTSTLLSREQLAFIQPFESRLKKELDVAQKSFVKQSQKKRRRERVLLWVGVAAAFAIALCVIVFVIDRQQRTANALENVRLSEANTKMALSNLQVAQADRERTELKVLLQNAAQISKGGNCPPRDMMADIDSIYQAHRTEPALQMQYDATMKKLTHCK